MQSAWRFWGQRFEISFCLHEDPESILDAITVLLDAGGDQKDVLVDVNHRHLASTSGTDSSVLLGSLIETVEREGAHFGVLEPLEDESVGVKPEVHPELEHVHGLIEALFAGVLAVVDCETKVC